MTVVTVAPKTERITIDLPAQDYAGLKLVAAAGGRGSTMTGIVRRLIHEYLASNEDAADLALVAQRARDSAPSLTSQQVDQALAEHRAGK
ncbi:MAG: hypothetical protein LBR20_03205 [Propionibacteriaceae bacterium]|jgi:hypothetical protein|nr:hypothetical protein [Propionibacteriaceae bacterium]